MKCVSNRLFLSFFLSFWVLSVDSTRFFIFESLQFGGGFWMLLFCKAHLRRSGTLCIEGAVTAWATVCQRRPMPEAHAPLEALRGGTSCFLRVLLARVSFVAVWCYVYSSWTFRWLCVEVDRVVACTKEFVTHDVDVLRCPGVVSRRGHCSFVSLNITHTHCGVIGPKHDGWNYNFHSIRRRAFEQRWQLQTTNWSLHLE